MLLLCKDDSTIIYIDGSTGVTQLTVTGIGLHQGGNVFSSRYRVAVSRFEIGISEFRAGSAAVLGVLDIAQRIRALGLFRLVYIYVLGRIQVTGYAALEVGYSAFLGRIGAESVGSCTASK